MKLIVGLGNPGPQYEKTRHNIGFTLIDELRKDLELEKFSPNPKFSAELSAGHFSSNTAADEKILLAKPTTFMNLSGVAVAALMEYYKIPPQDTWILYDDIDLPFGQLRIRAEGSPGTHNGMKNIVATCGTSQFPRFRFGIESRGATAPEKQDTASFVLARFTPQEEEMLAEHLKKAVKALKTALSDGFEPAMNEHNKPTS